MQERLVSGAVTTLLIGMSAGMPAAAVDGASVFGTEDLRLADGSGPQLCEAATGDCEPLDAREGDLLRRDGRLRERFASGELGRPAFGPRVLATGVLASLTPGLAAPLLEPLASPAVLDGLTPSLREAVFVGGAAGSLLPDPRIPAPVAVANLLRDLGL